MVRDTREPVVLSGALLRRTPSVPIPNSTSKVEFQTSNVLQGGEIFFDRLENIFIHVAQVKVCYFRTNGREERFDTFVAYVSTLVNGLRNRLTWRLCHVLPAAWTDLGQNKIPRSSRVIDW